MLNEPVVATMILLGLLALGEIISIATRARVPMLLVVLMGYLILIWTGVFSTELVNTSSFAIFGSILIAPLIVHMGTLIPLSRIKKQWKSVIVALLGIIIAAILILLVCTPFIGYEAAAAGTGPLTGGIIAFIIMSDGLKEIGLVSLVAIPLLVLSLQSIVGLPVAINLLRKYSIKLQRKMELGTFEIAATSEAVIADEIIVEKATKIRAGKGILPKKYENNVTLLFLLFVGGSLAVILGNLTGIHYSLWALLVGLIGTFAGFYKENMMVRSNSFGLAMVGLIFILFPSMNDITFQSFISYLPPVAFILIIGAIGIMIGGFIGSKLLKWDPFLGMPVALTAMFGFPGDYIVCEEVSRSVGKTEEEQKAIFDEILAPMLIGGFTTVTTASIVIASILVKTL